MRWILRLFERTQPPERNSNIAPRDPAYYEARQAYQDDKQAAMAKQIEILARLNRMGYDVDVVTRKRPDDFLQ